MRPGANPERLADAWNQIVDLLGPCLGQGAATARAVSRLFVVDAPLRFERGPLLARTTLRPDGRVAGFFLLLEDATAE